MNLIIDLTPSEEARLSAVVAQTGLATNEWVKKLVKQYLPAIPASGIDVLDANLSKWQKQDSTALMPEIAAQTFLLSGAKKTRA